MMNFVLNMMNSTSDREWAGSEAVATEAEGGGDEYSVLNGEFCTENDDFCIKMNDFG